MRAFFRKLGIGAGLILLALVGYLIFWPIDIDPVAWEAPDNPGYVGAFAANTALSGVEMIELGAHGPEDIEIRDGRLYASSQGGLILTHDLVTGAVREFADTGGVPLGIEFDAQGRLLVADAHKGLLRADGEGGVEVLLSEFGGAPIVYADDVDQAGDGTICFSDASTRFGAEAIGSTLAASLYEIMEHGATGRVICTDADGGAPYVLIDNLSFPNGVAFTPEGDLLVNVTGTYETLRVDRDGGASRFAGPYPGFPDNINPGPVIGGEPTYILGLVSPRSAALDRTAGSPFLRRVIWRLPEAMRPTAEDYGHLLLLDSDGRVLASLQDPAGGYAQVTGGQVSGQSLYLSSLTEPGVARLPLPPAFKE